MRKENIERIFNQDSREKKRTGANITKRASRRGYCRGGVKFPSDYLSRKEKRKLNGEVKVYSKYENLNNLPRNIAEVFKGKSNEEIKDILTKIKEKNTIAEICLHFKFTAGTLSYYLYKYGVNERKKRSEKKSGLEEMSHIPSWSEIQKMPVEKQFTVCFNAKEQFGTTKLCKHWGKSSTLIHKLFTSLGIYEAQKKKQIEKVDFKEDIIIEVKDPEVKEINNKDIEEKQVEIEKLNYELLQANIKIRELEEKIIQVNKKESVSGLEISFNDTVSKEELKTRLLSIAGIAAEDKKYKISINLKEINEK